MHGGLWIPKTGSDIACATGTPAEAPFLCEINGSTSLYKKYLYLDLLLNPSFSHFVVSMEGNKTRTLENSAVLAQFLNYCMKVDEKSETLLNQYDISSLKEDDLRRMLFRVTRFSRIARSIASTDYNIFGQRLNDNLVAVNIARWGNEPRDIKRMLTKMPAEDLTLRNSEGYSMAELIAVKCDDESMIKLVETADADSLRRLKTHGGEIRVTRLLWDRGSLGVRIALSGIGASYGKLETFNDVWIVGASTTTIEIDAQKACNGLWNWMGNNLLRRTSDEAAHDGDRDTVAAIKTLRKLMVEHKKDATPDLIRSTMDKIDAIETGRKTQGRTHGRYDS